VSLIVLMLCAAATSSLVARAEATYTSEASLILLPPSVKLAEVDNVERLTNPFLTTGIPLTANAITSASTSDRVGDLLKAAGLADVKWEVVGFDQSPIIALIVKSPAAADTTAGVQIVVKAVQDITAELQLEAKSPNNQFITAQLLAPPPAHPIESLAAKAKIGMGMAVASFLVVLSAALLFDNLVARRRARKARNRNRRRPDQRPKRPAAAKSTGAGEKAKVGGPATENELALAGVPATVDAPAEMHEDELSHESHGRSPSLSGGGTAGDVAPPVETSRRGHGRRDRVSSR
jgi:hypothetical protein